MTDTVEQNCIAAGILPSVGNAEMTTIAAALPQGVEVLSWRRTQREAREAKSLWSSMPDVHVCKCGTGFAICWRPPT